MTFYNILLCIILILIAIRIVVTFDFYSKKTEINFKSKVSILLLLFIAVLSILVYNYSYEYFRLDKSKIEGEIIRDRNAIWGQYGDFIGGVFGTLLTAFAGYFAYKAYSTQKEQLNNQKEETKRLIRETKKQQFETRFFELLKVHRDNLEQIEFDVSKVEPKKKEKVFRYIVEVFKKVYPLFYYLNIEIEDDTKRKETSISQTWLLLFFGYKLFCIYVQDGNIKCNEKIKKLLQLPHVKPPFLDSQLYFMMINEGIISNVSKGNIDFVKIYLHMKGLYGFQSALDKYFRHLFQTVKYINKQENYIINYKEKYNYAKTLRAQLSNSEQVVTFLNSMSFLGKPWEPNRDIDYEKSEYTEEFIKISNKNLITKYNFIKNIPLKYFDSGPLEIDFTKIYPNVHYEHLDKKSTLRKKIEEIYK